MRDLNEKEFFLRNLGSDQATDSKIQKSKLHADWLRLGQSSNWRNVIG